MTKPRVIIVGQSDECGKVISNLVKSLKALDAEVRGIHPRRLEMPPFEHDRRDCKDDHGERTNYRLQDQPFYMRGRNGKMRGY